MKQWNPYLLDALQYHLRSSLLYIFPNRLQTELRKNILHGCFRFPEAGKLLFVAKQVFRSRCFIENEFYYRMELNLDNSITWAKNIIKPHGFPQFCLRQQKLLEIELLQRPYSRKSCLSFVQVEYFRWGIFQLSKNEISRRNVKLYVRFLKGTYTNPIFIRLHDDEDRNRAINLKTIRSNHGPSWTFINCFWAD